MRNGMKESMFGLNFASKLWGLFKALISGAFSEMVELGGEDKTMLWRK